jgi:hypothetical protein
LDTYHNQASKKAGAEPEKPMITVVTLTYLAALSNTPVQAQSTPRERALAVFDVATRLDGVKWYANHTLVAVLSCGAGDYCVTVAGVEIDKGTLGATLATVERFVAGFDPPLHRPTPTTCAYWQFGIWVDMQDGYLKCNPMSSDGGWDEDFSAIEFACDHMVAHANADFGTSFTMDDFDKGDDCSCVT